MYSANALKRRQIRREYVVEQRPRPAFANPADDFRSAQPEFVQDHAGDERRSIEAQSAMREHAMPAADQLRAESRDRVEAGERRQILVVDWKVDVQAAFRRGWNAFIEAGIEIDDRVDAELRDW